MSNLSCFLSNFRKRFAPLIFAPPDGEHTAARCLCSSMCKTDISALSFLLSFLLINQTQFLHLKGKTVMEDPEAVTC